MDSSITPSGTDSQGPSKPSQGPSNPSGTDSKRPNDPIAWAVAAAVVTMALIALIAVLVLAGFSPDDIADLVRAVGDLLHG